MSDTAIRVENLGKLYRIGAARQRHDTLRDALSARFRNPSPMADHRPQTTDRGASSIVHGPSSTFWALRDVSFEVQRGEVVGVIGRNGAGKSTLLKILSRITEPTTGRVELHGRVGSLLEVGTGFHPELTGRENIYLNGAILGMKKAEIARRFDEIVAFAEIERFLDTPVKRYSSGMYVRLAFAVAAHLEPEILLVDEVLAVGDAAFQKKCLGKMGEVAGQGRTVLFVSHNMAAVSNLCSQTMLLDNGGLRDHGPSDQVIQHYVSALRQAPAQPVGQRPDRTGNGAVRIVGLSLQNGDGVELSAARSGEDIAIVLTYVISPDSRCDAPIFSFAFYGIMGQPLFLCRSDYTGREYRGAPRTGMVRCRIPKLPLPGGVFRLNVQVEANGLLADRVEDAMTVTVIEGDFYGSGKVPPPSRGDLLVVHEWLPAVPLEEALS